MNKLLLNEILHSCSIQPVGVHEGGKILVWNICMVFQKQEMNLSAIA